MSRVAKKPIILPAGVSLVVNDQQILVKGHKGELSLTVPASVGIVQSAEGISFSFTQHDASALAGTYRALTQNMVQGVHEGFTIEMELIGTGYKALLQGKNLVLNLGFSHPINFPIPSGISIEVPAPTTIMVKGAEKQLVGQVAAKIRSFRPPEPYKGKGVRIKGEVIRKKEAKKK